ncbi:cell division cycle protein 20 homolog [Asterias amurensis]|uniref:cell division cycle protein 20 homolog n=1 Tax=Asterias amurensis TaxID=7602 RepID=UPI003AB8BE12
MAHLQFEASISELVRLDGPLLRAPKPRWQRKAMERKDSLDSFSKSPQGLCQPKTPTFGGSFRTPLGDASFRGSKTPGKTPSKTPGKTPGKKRAKSPSKASGTSSVPIQPPANQGDRFIPNRALMDMNFSHFKINNREDVDEGEDKKENGYNSALSEMLNGKQTENADILTLKEGPPKPQEGYYNNLKVLYSSSKSAVKSKPGRFIRKAADRVLDAPELRDDFYLTLLDWGSRNFVAVALHDEVYLWNAVSGTIEHLMKLEGADDYVSGVSWIREGNVLAVGNAQGQVQLWDVEKTKCLRVMGGHAARIAALSWSSFILTSGSRSGMIHNHDVRVENHHVATLESHTQEVCGLKWSPDGKYLASGGNDNMVNVWDASAGTGTAPVYSFTQHRSAVKALAWCPWQPNILASGGGTADRQIRFWNSLTGLCLNSLDTGSQVSSIQWSAEHKEVVSSHGYAHNQLSIWKYPMMQHIADLRGHTNRVLTMCMSPDQTMVMSAAADETLRLWHCFTSEGSNKSKSTKSGKKTVSHALSVGQIR